MLQTTQLSISYVCDLQNSFFSDTA